MKAILTGLFAQTVVVKKTRKLFLYKNSRIHLDSVRGLGRFVEFEVVVNRGVRQARALMKFLRTTFKIDNRKTISASYGDLLLKKARDSGVRA